MSERTSDLSDDRVVVLKGGLTIPVPALLLLLDLEARGARFEPNEDGGFAVWPRKVLTDADRQALRRWKPAIRAMLEYEPGERPSA